METNGKLSTKFVERFLNGSPFSSQDLNYEKPEVIKKTINSTYNIKNQLNGVCPMKNIENGYHNVNNHNGHTNGLTNGHANGLTNGHTNGLTNGHTNGLTNGHTNGLTNGHTNGHINSESEDKENQTEKKPLQYGDYLQLEKLLSCQLPRTRILRDKEIHDEHLFIITHQIYELWFLQILVELNSTRELITEKIELKNDSIFTGENVSKIRSRLNRMLVIFKLLISQWDVLNTMTAPDFVEFRAYLKPASGFQSLQFRLIENKLGVRTDSRANYGKCNYLKVFSQDNNKINTLKNSENDPSLHDLIERWLEKQSTDEFIKKYRKAANRELKDLEALINESKIVNSDLTEDYLKDLTKKQQLIEHWTNEDRYNELVKRGDRRLSFKAFKTLLCIHVHKDDFKFSMMFQILETLQEIDEALSSWRGKHVSIVKKMIGTDLNGTGGSSGYQYLKSTTTDRYKIFNDIGSIGSYLISHQFMKDYD